jgi:hypothetical protein
MSKIWTPEMVEYLRENHDSSAAQISVDLYRLTGTLMTAQQINTKRARLKEVATKGKREFRLRNKYVPYSYAMLQVGEINFYVTALLTEPYFMEAGDTLAGAAKRLRDRYIKWSKSKWRAKEAKPNKMNGR